MEHICKKKGTGIVFWNLRSLINKFDNFKATIVDTNFKVFCITESWLKQNLDSSYVAIEGYNIFRSDRRTLNEHGFNKRGGGIIIYTDINLDVRKISDGTLTFSDCDAEIFTLQIKIPYT